MTGAELARRAKQLVSSLRVLLISGYPADALAQYGPSDTEVELLRKPFDPPTLARAIRRVLTGGPDRSVDRESPR